MRLGASQEIITPFDTVELAGYVLREQPSEGVLDDLYARALFFQEGDARLLWIHADLIGFSRPWTLALRQALAEELGLGVHEILLTATHTHAGPATLPLRGCGQMDEQYMAFLEEALKGVARRAAANAEEVSLFFAEGFSPLAKDRRGDKPSAHVNHQLPVLSFRRADGSYVAVWANYGMHNVALSWENRLISGDMAGHAARMLQQRLQGEPVILWTNGACGNVNPAASSALPKLMQGYGDSLVIAAMDAIRRSQPVAETTLAVAEKAVALDLEIPTDEEIEQAYAATLQRAEGHPRVQRAMDEWREQALAAIAEGAPAQVEVGVHAIRLGPLRLAAIGAEVFSHMTEALRAILGFRTYVVGYANGVVGYLAPRVVYDEGGYEIEDAYKYYGLFRLAPDSYDRVYDEALALLQSLEMPPQAEAAMPSEAEPSEPAAGEAEPPQEGPAE